MPKRNRNQGYGSTTEREAERTDRLELQGTVDECLPGTLFKVKCSGDHNGHIVLCTLGGKLRQNRIRLLPGDNVTVEVSPYDLSRGRVTRRR